MYGFNFDVALFLVCFFVTVYIAGVCASYAVGITICTEARVRYHRGRLFHDATLWPWYLLLLFVHGVPR